MQDLILRHQVMSADGRQIRSKDAGGLPSWSSRAAAELIGLVVPTELSGTPQEGGRCRQFVNERQECGSVLCINAVVDTRL